MRTVGIAAALVFTLILSRPVSAEVLPSTALIRAPVESGEGPLEAIAQDSLVQDWRYQSHRPSSAPGPQRAWVQEMPLSMRETGRAGELAQIRGIGISAEDTNVQVFGVPLNYAQGGGFDLSVFPAFLWWEMRLRLGGNPISLDPRGVSGTASLTPWTSKAIRTESSARLLAASYSGSGVGQAWTSFSSPGNSAVIGGWSFGKLRGPSAMGSAQLVGDGTSGGWNLSLHLLATAVEADIEGSTRFPTPFATQASRRVIPIVEASKGNLALAGFADFTRIQYVDPSSNYSSDDRSAQQGFQLSYRPRDLSGRWNLGFGERAVQYRTLDFDPPNEWITHLSLGRTQYLDEEKVWALGPAISLMHVNRFGALPQPSLGVRREFLNGELSAFVNGSLAHRVPSMLDRYYNVVGFAGNPNLLVEKVWSLSTGLDLSTRSHSARLEAVLQWRRDAQVQVTDPVTYLTMKQNRDFAQISSVQLSDAWKPWASLRLRHALAWAGSRVSGTQFAVPYQPTWTTTQAISWLPLGSDSLETGLRIRSATRAVYDVSTGETLPGYALADFFCEGSLKPDMTLGLSVENVMGRSIQLVRDYPLKRVFSASLRVSL